MGIRFIVATFLLFVSSFTANAQVTDIFDMDGDVVVYGRQYYILPVVQRRGGGISTAPESATQTCPLYVAQETNTAALGIPVIFSPSKTKPVSPNVTFSIDMNIVFALGNNCKQSPIWKLKLDEATGTRFVVPGGVPMARGPVHMVNWFRIVRFFPRFHFDYKFHFCPEEELCRPACDVSKCGDLGVEVQLDGTWRLAVGAAPLRVKFKKA